MTPVIQTSGLTKYYPGKPAPALKDLNLSIERGEIFGYLGPNGAGKTTTIHLMLDFLRPSAGHVQIMGLDVQQHSTAIRQSIGNLPGELRLWDHLTGRQILHYLANLRPNCDLNYAFELAERLGLQLDLRAKNYSTGNKRKVGIVQAMMHRPALLILDEPTNGLDPLVRQTFHHLLKEAQANGQTVFLSSHVISEVQTVCDRVAILRDGHLQRMAHVSQLDNDVERIITLYSRDDLIPEAWEHLESVQQVEQQAGVLRLRVRGSLDPIIKFAANYTIDDMRIEAATLEHVFMDLYD